MLKLKSQKTVFLLMVFLIFMVASFLLSVSLGAYRIPIRDIIKAIVQYDNSLNARIIANIRIPRSLVAALVGVSLAMAGAILQGVMRNPLASPNIIGVSSGAGFMATVALILFPKMSFMLTPVAFIGALATTILIYILSWKNGIQPLRMILAGIAISTLLNAFISLILIFYPERVSDTLGFKIGSLAAITWHDFYQLLPYTLIGFILAVFSASKLNVLMLGDDIAISLGLNVELVRLFLIILSSVLAASAVSVVGLLGFVGLIVPHIARILVGSDYRVLFLASAILGAGLVMLCDTIARIAFAPIELPIGIVMSIIGVPFFLYLLKGGMKNARAK